MSLGKLYKSCNIIIDQESITISDADNDNIDESPMDHDVLSKMNANQSMVEKQ